MNPAAPQSPTPPAAPPVPPAASSAQPSAINYGAFLQASASTPKLWLTIGLIGGVLFILIVIVSAGRHDELLATLMTWASILTVMGSLLAYAWQKQKRDGVQLAQFIQDNGWQPVLEPTGDTVATSLLDAGRDQTITQAFGGSYHGVPFTAVHYQYVTGSGRSQETHHFIDLAFEVQRDFPLIVLDDKRNNFLMFSDLPTRIPNGQPLELEGDFNDRFRTTVLPNTQQEVLEVLTPDFMADLMAQTARADIELEANRLFIIKEAETPNRAILQDLFTMADVMIKNLGELSATWQASSSIDSVAAMTDTALTPRAKLLLRPKHVGIGALVGIGLFLVMLVLTSASK